MTQAGVSSPLSTGGSLVSPGGAYPMTDDRQFVFDLDVFQRCVHVFDPKVTTGDARSGSNQDEMLLRDAEDPLTCGGVEMLDLSCFDAFDLNKQHGPPMWGKFNSKAPEVEVSPTRLSKQPKSRDRSHLPVPKKKNRSQNQSRKRQREELAHLRASAQELQLQLVTLLNASDPSSKSTSADTSELTCSLSQRTNQELFVRQVLARKRAAATEKQQSEHAAAENMKLRALIEENAQCCENLREACSKRSISQLPCGGFQYDRVVMKKPTAFNTVSDSAIFASLREGLDAQYQRVDAVWAECDFNTFDTVNREESKLRSDSDGKSYLEHTKSRVSPFTPHAMSGAVLKLVKSGLLMPTNGELKMCRILGNTLYATLEDTIRLPNAQDATIKVWASMKRFIEDHRIVTVSQILMEVGHSKRTIQITKNGWSVVQSVVGVHKKTTKCQRGLHLAPSISQTCIRSIPGQNCTARENELTDGSLTVLVLNQFHDNMGMLDQTIENFLLDESLARSSGSGGSGTGSGCRGDSSGSARFSGSPSGAAV